MGLKRGSFSSIVSSLHDYAYGVGAARAAHALREAAVDAGHLSGARLTPDLPDHLCDLVDAGGPDRVLAPDEPAGGVHRVGPAHGRAPVGKELRALSPTAEAELLVQADLDPAERVVDLGDLDRGRRVGDAGHLVRRVDRGLDRREERLAGIVALGLPPRLQARSDARYPDRLALEPAGGFLAGEDDGGGALAVEAVVEYLQGVDDRGALHDVFDRDVHRGLGVRVVLGIAFVLDHHPRHVLLGGAVVLHVPDDRAAVGPRGRGAEVGFEERVRGESDRLYHLEHVGEVGDFLHAYHHHHVMEPACDLGERGPDGVAARSPPGGDAHRGFAGEAELVVDMMVGHHAVLEEIVVDGVDHAVDVRALRTGILHRHLHGLVREPGERLVDMSRLERRVTDSDDCDLLHLDLPAK